MKTNKGSETPSSPMSFLRTDRQILERAVVAAVRNRNRQVPEKIAQITLPASIAGRNGLKSRLMGGRWEDETERQVGGVDYNNGGWFEVHYLTGVN